VRQLGGGVSPLPGFSLFLDLSFRVHVTRATATAIQKDLLNLIKGHRKIKVP